MLCIVYSIHVTEQFSCTFCEIFGTQIGDYPNFSHLFVRNSPTISPPSPLYSIHVCKKITRNFNKILVTGIGVIEAGGTDVADKEVASQKMGTDTVGNVVQMLNVKVNSQMVLLAFPARQAGEL